MIIRSATNALPPVIRVQSNEPERVDEPIFDSKKHKDGDWIETNKITSPTRMETPKVLRTETPTISSIQSN